MYVLLCLPKRDTKAVISQADENVKGEVREEYPLSVKQSAPIGYFQSQLLDCSFLLIGCINQNFKLM